MIITREHTISNKLFEVLEYFAQGGMAYSDSLPSGLPNQDLFPVLVEQQLIQEVDINPNELRWYSEKPNRHSYYIISPKGKELYFLEKEVREERAKQEEEDRTKNMQAVQDKKQQFRHDYSVATFSELVSTGLPHLLPKLIELIKTLFKSGIIH